MTSENKSSPSLVDVGAGIIDFYLKKTIGEKLPIVIRTAISSNPQVDPEFIEESIKSEVYKHIPEVSEKINYVSLLIVEHLVSGRFDVLRKFEVLFTDLLERTLLKEFDFSKFLEGLKGEIMAHFKESIDNMKDPPRT